MMLSESLDGDSFSSILVNAHLQFFFIYFIRKARRGQENCHFFTIEIVWYLNFIAIRPLFVNLVLCVQFKI
jgi:hypothetical protein